MGELDEARARKSALWGRYKEARAAAAETRDPAERRRQQDRARILNAMYQEACADVRRLDPSAKQSREKWREENGSGGAALDALMRSGALWADLQGESWSRLSGYAWGGERASTGRATQALSRMVREGVERCTPRQKEVLLAYYTTEDTAVEIGARLGVDKSVISRTITRGLQRVSRHITAKLLIQRCVDRDGFFDYLTFVNSAQVLTERQREMMFLALAGDTSYTDMARYVQRHRSCVWRVVERVERNLNGLAVELDAGRSSVKIRRRDWEGLTEKELAQRLGLSARFYYGTVCRGRTAAGLPLLEYAALRRTRETGDPGLTAAELGCSVAWVKKTARKYQGLVLPDVALEPYHPVRPKRVRLPENPYAAFGEGGAIIDRIDGETYRALQAKFGTA